LILNLKKESLSRHKMMQVVTCFHNGGVVIIPTDTVYAYACDLFNTTAIEKMRRIKGEKERKFNFSLLCHDLGHLTDFAVQVDTPTFRILNKALPGPYTFILKASSQVPKLFQIKKKTIGIRVPDNDLTRMIIKELGNPLLCTSLKNDTDTTSPYISDPKVIDEKFGDSVNYVVDGGPGGTVPSTVIDCTGDEPVVIREGKGKLFNFA
jgi:tRNA threonylcarbamoyl adenosine modification protein (Sua5/YciO/YrdC/YwlC family)